MGSKTFRSLHDFVRHGTDLWIECRNGPCRHHGIVGAHDAVKWFRVHRFSDNLESALGAKSAYDHFRCTKCGARAGSIKPTNNAITVVDFFPLSPDAWVKLARRMRG